MKRLLGAGLTLAVALLLAASGLTMGGMPTLRAQGEQCTPVEMESGETDEGMTARIVVGSGATRTVTGQVDASACDIGVYAAPGSTVAITSAEIVGGSGTAFGVFNNGANVTIRNSTVHGILGNGQGCGDGDADDGEECGGGGMGGGGGGGEGDMGYTGGRHGTGILYTGGGARGTISATRVYDYGRRGISVSGVGASAHISGNTITGQVGGAEGMWRNGIWIANGARGTITGNWIFDNITGTGIMGKASSAIMVVGGPNHSGMPNYTTHVQITGNTLVDNDIGVWLSNGPVLTDVPTNNAVSGNTVRANTGFVVRQNGAGIKDGGASAGDEGASGGNRDYITGNHVFGYGDKSFVIGPPSIDIFDRGNISH